MVFYFSCDMKIMFADKRWNISLPNEVRSRCSIKILYNLAEASGVAKLG